MSTRAHIEHDRYLRGVRLAVARERGYLSWQPPVFHPHAEEGGQRETPEAWLTLEEEDARAIYEALAEFFGHTGHDIRALQDYDAERGRVDRLINNLLGSR